MRRRQPADPQLLAVLAELDGLESAADASGRLLEAALIRSTAASVAGYGAIDGIDGLRLAMHRRRAAAVS